MSKKESKLTQLSEMQQDVDQYIQQFKIGYFSPLTQMAQITEEVGELAREINHCYGEKTKKASETNSTIAEELGDLLITTLILANSLEIDLTTSYHKNMKKFRLRDAHRFERKDGNKS